MPSLLERELIVITGKGGVGKTTLTAALGVLAVRRGLRTIMVEVGDQQRLPALFGHSAAVEHGVETALRESLASLTVDPDRVLLRWLSKLGGRLSARVLSSSSTFQYFVAAAPGAREILSMIEIWDLVQPDKRRPHGRYDLVILDAPASGHALAMLRAPQTFATIARVGPIASQAQRVQELLRDPARSGYVAVALGTELAVTETLELRQGLREGPGRELDAIIVNGTLPRRFSDEDLAQIEATAMNSAAAVAAAHAARTVHTRHRTQQNQIARLRRRRSSEAAADGEAPATPVLTTSFVFQPKLDLAAVEALADQLDSKL